VLKKHGNEDSLGSSLHETVNRRNSTHRSFSSLKPIYANPRAIEIFLLSGGTSAFSAVRSLLVAAGLRRVSLCLRHESGRANPCCELSRRGTE